MVASDWLVPLLVGVVLMQAVMLGFMFFTADFSETSKILTMLLGVVAVWKVAGHFFNLQRYHNLYKVSREIIPSFELQFFKGVNSNKVRCQLFRGFYLCEYPDDNLVVAWQKDVGVVSRESMSLRDFKKEFNPQEFAETSAEVLGEDKRVLPEEQEAQA